jgi:hypothetical protein
VPRAAVAGCCARRCGCGRPTAPANGNRAVICQDLSRPKSQS